MPELVTGNGTCEVLSPDGRLNNCAFPLITFTDECSDKVTVNGDGVVCEGDKVTPHLRRGCDPSPLQLDDSELSTFSSKVTINGKGVARVGDMYGDNEITQGVSKIICG